MNTKLFTFLVVLFLFTGGWAVVFFGGGGDKGSVLLCPIREIKTLMPIWHT